MAPGCSLCGVDCGREPLRRGFGAADLAFCCPGCLNVYAILAESGVVEAGKDLRETELYRTSLALGLISNRTPRAPQSGIPPDAAVEERLFQVGGMWCWACAWLIEQSLAGEPGIASAEVSFATDLLKVRFHPQYLPPDRIGRRLAALGYTIEEFTGDGSAADAERRSLLIRLGLAAFLWLNVMMFNIAVYLGQAELARAGVAGALPFLAMALATPVVFYSALPVLRQAWLSARGGTARMETLLSIGILSAYAYSAVQAFRGGSHIYFDISCAIVTLVLLGKWIERTAKAKALRSLACFHRMMPKKARVLTGAGQERFIPIEALAPGTEFLVKAGERIPADGLVTGGESHVDESLLSGEAKPAAKRPGSRVAGGSVNGGGVLRVRATAGAEGSALAQIIAAVERAISGRSGAERLANRVARAFVPVVTASAALCFAGWMWAGLPAAEAMMRAITVLVIACPCALGVATPLAVAAAVEHAAARGVLVGDGRVLDTVEQIDAIVLDKTGTLTQGEFTLLAYDPEGLFYVASLERYSEHPLGRAAVQEAERAGIQLAAPSEVEIANGEGISGLVEGRRVFAGSPRYAARFDPRARQDPEKDETRTVVVYGWDGAVRGRLIFGDRLRPDAREVAQTFRRRGVEVHVVSGDSPAAARWAAGAVGADGWLGEVSPAGKADFIARLQGEGKRVAMIGDGMNDAPALARADLGIALGTGTDLAMRSAAMVLMGGRLGGVLDAFDVVRRARGVIRQNLFWSFFYNTMGIALAAAGLLNPVAAAGAMVLSSGFVLGNTLRLKRSRARAAAGWSALFGTAKPADAHAWPASLGRTAEDGGGRGGDRSAGTVSSGLEIQSAP